VSDQELDQVVVLTLNDERIAVKTGLQALTLLEHKWPLSGAASQERAFHACAALIDGTGSSAAARATFCVAAMEAGIAFELFSDAMALMEFDIAALARDAIRDSDS